MRIAAIQHDIVWEDREANFERCAGLIARAAGTGAELALLAETFSTGFSMTPGIGERQGGPSSQFLIQQARAHGVWVGATCPEVPDGALLPYNAFVLAGPDGTVHRYHKVHPFTYGGEHNRYVAGDRLVTVTIAGVRCSLFVCYDLRFAEEFWRLAPVTDVYLVPANWPAPRRLHWRALLQGRAIENQAYVVGCNRVGSSPHDEYIGDSTIISPLGEVLATAAETESIVLADVDPEIVADARRRFRFMSDRRHVAR
ncbi:MAG: carbon-nitrogen family hydrolase [Acidimicrobiia bacterium]